MLLRLLPGMACLLMRVQNVGNTAVDGNVLPSPLRPLVSAVGRKLGQEVATLLLLDRLNGRSATLLHQFNIVVVGHGQPLTGKMIAFMIPASCIAQAVPQLIVTAVFGIRHNAAFVMDSV